MKTLIFGLLMLSLMPAAQALDLTCGTLTDANGTQMENVAITVRKADRGNRWVLNEIYLSGRALSRTIPLKRVKKDARGGVLYAGAGYTFGAYAGIEYFVNLGDFSARCYQAQAAQGE